jgi:hypothetical protein
VLPSIGDAPVQRTTDLTIQILRMTLNENGSRRVDTVPVQLARRFLARALVCCDVLFGRGQQVNEINHSQSVKGAFDGDVLQLWQLRAYQGVSG